MSDNPQKGILPISGIWTVEGLAEYLEMDANQLQDRLSEYGIKTMVLSNRHKHKLIKLEDVAAKIGTGKHEVQP